MSDSRNVTTNEGHEKGENVTTTPRHEKRVGRPPVGAVAMTPAERQRRRRERIKGRQAEIRAEDPTFDLRVELFRLIEYYECLHPDWARAEHKDDSALLGRVIDWAGQFQIMRAHRRFMEPDRRCTRDERAWPACFCDECSLEMFLLGEWPYGPWADHPSEDEDEA